MKANLFDPNDYSSGIIVDISRVISSDKYDKIKQKQISKKDLKNSDYLNSKNININNNGQKVINYVLKYTTKENNLFNGDNWSFEYDKQIKGKRLISTFGTYKEELAKYRREKRYHHYNEAEFLDKLKSRANIKDIEDSNVFYCVYDNEYLAERTTLSKALFNKRHMIVKNIEKKQTDSSQVAFIGHTTQKDLDKQMKIFDDTPSNKNFEALNKVITDMNLSKKNKRALHQRLVNAGHRVMINEYQYYIKHDESVIYDTFDFAFDTDLIDVNDVYLEYDNIHNLEILDSFSQLPC